MAILNMCDYGRRGDSATHCREEATTIIELFVKTEKIGGQDSCNHHVGSTVDLLWSSRSDLARQWRAKRESELKSAQPQIGLHDIIISIETGSWVK